MKQDDLIAKLLDGSITPNERNALEAAARTSPELASEISELQAVEESLRSAAEKTHSGAAAYRQDIKSELKRDLNIGAAAGRSLLPWFGTSLGILGVGTILMYMILTQTNESSVEPELHVATPAEKNAPQEILQPEPPALQPVPQTHVSEIVDSSRNKRATHTPSPRKPRRDTGAAVASVLPERSERSSVSDTLNTKVESPARNHVMVATSPKTPTLTDQAREKIALFKDAMRLRLSEGRTAQAAASAHKLGALYTDIARRNANAALRDSGITHFALAERYARSGGAIELEAFALGEQALLNAESGAIDQARTQARRCVQILDSLKSAKLEFWRERERRILGLE